jgi:sn-glycerol 3-phosphate transport system substrate-binding protein
LFIVSKSSPAKQEAAWRFAKFLNEPEQQAEWAAATGYVPIRQSAATLPAVSERWAAEPGYKVAYDQLLSGVENEASAGAVIGPYGAQGDGVRGALIDAVTSLLNSGLAPEQAVDQAATKANAELDEYNERLGVG